MNRKLQNATSPLPTSDVATRIMDNISFLNRNCKFLSYVEKERLINSLKAQDPDAESFISCVRENNPPKDELKTVFYAFLYPKQATKKALDAMQSQRSRNTATVPDSSKLKKTVPVSAVQLDVRGAGSSQSQKDSRTFGNRSTESRNQAPRGGVQASIQRLNQHLQSGGFYDVSPGGTRGRSSDVSRKQVSTHFGKNSGARSPKTAGGSLNNISNTPKYANKEHKHHGFERVANSHQVYNLTGHSDALESGSPYSGGGHADEGTSAEFLASLGLRTKGAVDRTPKSSEPLKKSNAASETKTKQTIKEITFGAHGSNAAKAELRKGANGNIKESSTSQWSDPNLWKQAALPRSTEPEHRGGTKSLEKRTTTEGTIRSEKGNFKLSGVSERTKEVLSSLLGDIGNGEMYQNIMKKLEDNAAAQALATRSEQPEYTESDDQHHQKNTKELSRSGIGFGQTTVSTNRRAEFETEIPIDERRGVSLGGEGEVVGLGLGLRTEKYVSVNMIKRILDSNLIYTEDIVDEVFRYLGENIVNKNYFAQIIGNYLNSLTEQHGIQTQDIVNKMFEICDRNGDGVISPNDLGSGATLFSQYRPTISKERRLYRILDPQNRGFVIETDITSVLTKTNTIASASGIKLYEGLEEITEVAKKLIKELDKEKKGIVTYWDIFLWKDTHSFSDLISQLERYMNKLDTLSSAKKSLISVSSPPPANQDLLSELHKRSPVAGQDLPRLYSAYSPDVSAHKGGSSSRVQTLGSDAVKPSQPGIYSSLLPVSAATPSNGIPKVGPSYLPTFQSPDNQGLIHHLSAFESLSKDIRGDEVVPTLASGMKDYPIDLTMSPPSKVYTPLKESSPIKEEKLKSSGVSPHKEEVKASPGSYLLFDKAADNLIGTNYSAGLGSAGLQTQHLGHLIGTNPLSQVYGASSSFGLESKGYMPGLASETQYKSPTSADGQGYLYTAGSVDAHALTSPLSGKPQTGLSEYKGYLPVYNTGDKSPEHTSPTLLPGNLQAKSYTYLKTNTHDFSEAGLLDKKELKESIYVNEGKNSGLQAQAYGSFNPSYSVDPRNYGLTQENQSSPSRSYKDYDESHGSPGSKNWNQHSEEKRRYVSQESPQYYARGEEESEHEVDYEEEY